MDGKACLQIEEPNPEYLGKQNAQETKLQSMMEDFNGSKISFKQVVNECNKFALHQSDDESEDEASIFSRASLESIEGSRARSESRF